MTGRTVPDVLADLSLYASCASVTPTLTAAPATTPTTSACPRIAVGPGFFKICLVLEELQVTHGWQARASSGSGYRRSPSGQHRFPRTGAVQLTIEDGPAMSET